MSRLIPLHALLTEDKVRQQVGAQTRTCLKLPSWRAKWLRCVPHYCKATSHPSPLPVCFFTINCPKKGKMPKLIFFIFLHICFPPGIQTLLNHLQPQRVCFGSVVMRGIATREKLTSTLPLHIEAFLLLGNPSGCVCAEGGGFTQRICPTRGKTYRNSEQQQH